MWSNIVFILLSGVVMKLDPNALAVVLYHIAILFAGISLCFMGYRLFTLGIVEAAGDVSGKWGARSIALKRAAPGTFFALFGAVIVVVAISHGIVIDLQSSTPARETQSVSISTTPPADSSFLPANTGTKTPSAPTAKMIVSPDDSNLLSAPLSSPAIPDWVTAILTKVVAGEQITEDERTRLAVWSQNSQPALVHHVHIMGRRRPDPMNSKLPKVN